MRGDRAARGPGVVPDLQRVTQVRRDVGRVGLRHIDAQRHDHGRRTAAGRLRDCLPARTVGQGDVVDGRHGATELVDGTAHVSGARAVARHEHNTERRGLRPIEVLRQRPLHPVGLRTRNVEATAGQVVGLPCGERHGRHKCDNPHSQHDSAATINERVELEQEPLHGNLRRRWRGNELAGRPIGDTVRDGPWLAGQLIWLAGQLCQDHVDWTRAAGHTSLGGHGPRTPAATVACTRGRCGRLRGGMTGPRHAWLRTPPDGGRRAAVLAGRVGCWVTASVLLGCAPLMYVLAGLGDDATEASRVAAGAVPVALAWPLLVCAAALALWGPSRSAAGVAAGALARSLVLLVYAVAVLVAAPAPGAGTTIHGDAAWQGPLL